MGIEESGTLGRSQAVPQGRATTAEICTRGFHMSKWRNFDPQLPPPCRNAHALAARRAQTCLCFSAGAAPCLSSAGPLTSLLPLAFQAEGCFQIWPSTNMLVLFSRDTQSQRSMPKGGFVIGRTVSFIVQLPWNKSPRH